MSEEIVEKPNHNTLGKLKKFLNEKLKTSDGSKQSKVAIFTHPSPDPDAIGSLMGMSWLLKKMFDVEVDCFFDGCISHPQNQRMVNLLDPELKLNNDYVASNYCLNLLVDTIPSHASCPENVNFDVVIDHHKDPPNGGFKGIFLNLKAGSCCSTVYQLIKEFQVKFEEDNAHDSRVATALLVGIITDTEYQTSDDTTDYEHNTYREIFEFRNSAALKQITKYKQPREWVQARAIVAQKSQESTKNGVLIHGIGFINSNNRDLIAVVADEMLSWENIETSIVFGIVDGERIEGSIRSSNAAISVPALCKECGGENGSGGGKLGKGAFSYSLGNLKSDDDDEVTKEKFWSFILDREVKRLLKILKN